MPLPVPRLAKNKTLKGFMCASCLLAMVCTVSTVYTCHVTAKRVHEINFLASFTFVL